jgi:hypothetical protein
MAASPSLGMSEIAVGVLATTTILLITWYLIGKWASQSSGLKLPPGPKGWPILGSLPLLSALPHHDLFKLSQQYGPLMFINLGSVRTLVVTSPKVAEVVLKTHDINFASRPFVTVTTVTTYNFSDIAFQPYGLKWRDLRKMCTVGLLTAHRISQFEVCRQKSISSRGNAPSNSILSRGGKIRL